MSGNNVPGIDLPRLLPWFRAHVARVDELTPQIIGHGRSNLTYRLQAGDESLRQGSGQAWVLRRPPLSHVQPTAHDMAREFRVLSALHPLGFPVPRPITLCQDAEVNGAPFYIMEYVEGLVPVDPNEVARRFDEARRRRIGEELVDVLVRLHTYVPEEIGLGDFGRPQGYLERQVRRFSEQIERMATEGTRETRELNELARRLAGAIPPERVPGIVHGDYRLDNAILDDDGHIIAVLDWEMSTLGDSLADLGLLRMYWADRGGAGQPLSVGGSAVILLPGFPTWEEAAARYEQKSGHDLSNLDFYVVLAHFKLGVILENMHRRFLAGGTVGPGFEMIGQQAQLLGQRGLAIADASPVAALRG
ncbi:MAG: phosphotransferase family protein [Chloroflexi bacterium]|nr:phosphotransferase family protein [Chloroflexota bacterium]